MNLAHTSWRYYEPICPDLVVFKQLLTLAVFGVESPRIKDCLDKGGGSPNNDLVPICIAKSSKIYRSIHPTMNLHLYHDLFFLDIGEAS